MERLALRVVSRFGPDQSLIVFVYADRSPLVNHQRQMIECRNRRQQPSLHIQFSDLVRGPLRQVAFARAAASAEFPVSGKRTEFGNVGTPALSRFVLFVT